MARLEVEELHTYFYTKRGIVKAVNGVTYEVDGGKTLGIVGESGSGKSVSAMSILRLLPDNGYLASGSIRYEGKELTEYTKHQMNQIRGNQISVIFQEPMTSLNPVLTVERQLIEPLRIHQGMDYGKAMQKVMELLAQVRIANPEAIAKEYAHQLSGGMRQRVMIAMALACNPGILIADEPTTALDVTIQAQILKLMNELKEKMKAGILFITHDLGVIREMADEVLVMYCGQVVERGNLEALFGERRYQHPYTEGLLNSIPRLDTPVGKRLEAIPGTVPHSLHLPTGCKFEPRCRYVKEHCSKIEPGLEEVEPGHWIRCFYPEVHERMEYQEHTGEEL